jgi:assimilatory nitrate reductase catalytic subunit
MRWGLRVSTATQTRSTCPYCGVGCGVIIESSREGHITGVRGDPEHPANFGRLCTKGSTLHHTATQAITVQTRLLEPLQRLSRGTAPTPITWKHAIHTAAKKFADTIQLYGPDSVGFYLSGQLLTEDYYVFNKLAKGLIGTNNVDTNSRLCMSSAVAGYKATLGADAPPTCYEDVDHATTLFISGANTAWAHPILYRRIEDARQANPDLKVIVADPRATETALAADLHLALLPGTDVALYHGMLHLMLWEGLSDAPFIAQHTHGFEALRNRVREFTPKEAAKLCGIQEDDLIQAARWFAAKDGRTLSLYCQGLNQSTSGTAKNAALINLHLASGQIGKSGAGPFSLTGQPNAMGGREVGGMANLLSGHRDLANPAHRAEVAQLWGIERVPSSPGKTAVEMFEATADGQIKALWISCTNPAQSMPNQSTVRRALERAEFVVVQEAFATTATCAYADLLLPATTWGEKEGTVTNSERCITRVRAAIPTPGQARHDWQAATDFAQQLAHLLLPSPTCGKEAVGEGKRQTPQPHFNYPTPESIWNEHRLSTQGRDLDITGLSYEKLEVAPAQWPYPTGATTGKKRLYEDHHFATPDGRAQFFDTPYAPVHQPRDARYPFALNTGRLRDQWHGMSRTGTLGRLFGHASEPSLDLHPQDMARLQLESGDLVQITSRQGCIIAPARSAPEVHPTQAFMAMHWGEEYLSGSHQSLGINTLTTPAFCPISKQPELKHTAVKIAKANLPWSLLCMAWLPEALALHTKEQLKPYMRQFAFTSCTPFGRERTGILFRAAHTEAAPQSLLIELEQLLGLSDQTALHYADPKQGQRRSMRLSPVDQTIQLEAFLIAGNIAAEAWIKPLLQDQIPAALYGRALLQPGAKPPVAVQSQGRQVCNCLNVTEPAITDFLSTCTGTPHERLNKLQATLKCGTECGSCLTEVKRMVQS